MMKALLPKCADYPQHLHALPVYGWFTEGFDTADLQEVKMLLDTTWKVMSQISDTLENSCFEINGLRKRP